MLRNFLQHNTSFVLSEVRALTFSNMYFYRGKHQTQPKLRMRTVKPIYPPPGENLELPDWTPEQFLLKIGGGCSEYADKFETLKEIFDDNRWKMKEKGIKPQQRKYIFRIREMLKRGVLTFEYLNRRTTYTLPDIKKKKKK